MNASRSGQRRQNVDSIVEKLQQLAERHLGFGLRPVQVDSGLELLGRSIVEMQTGEGKTLTTVIPAALMALGQRADDQSGGPRRVLIATANDYLASRDAEWMGPIYRDLGLSVGCVIAGSTTEQRNQAYHGDVVYGTLSQYAFDHLRASLAKRHPDYRGDAPEPSFEVLIVDEADSILIDEARTPMIITSPTVGIDSAMEACYRWSAELAASYRRDVDYLQIGDGVTIALTEPGRRRAIHREMPSAMGSLTTTDILHSLERAIWINEMIHRDRHYVVTDNRIHLIDEFTGRKMGDRNFGGGIQQAVEAREHLPMTPQSEPVARISVQDFVNQFAHVCGLTATAWEDRKELTTVFGLGVKRSVPHHTNQRIDLPPSVCDSITEKWKLIVEESRGIVEAGRAVLIGTRTVEQSEQLSGCFRDAGIDHVVLNARQTRQEASIIAQAGMPGRVTIATNMAGRGTDIRLDPTVARAGGLHVIVSEIHAAARIDRQLIGRCARGGDPGTARIYASPEDEILRQAFGMEHVERVARRARRSGPRYLLGILKQAQRRVSQLHRKERARLTAHEASLASSMQLLGLDPHLDPLPDSRR